MSVPAFDRGAMMNSYDDHEKLMANMPPGYVYDPYIQRAVTLEEARSRIASLSAMHNSQSILNSPSVLGSAAVHQARYPYLDLKQMILMRLHIGPGDVHHYEFLEAHRSDDTVHVFVVVNGKSVTLSDDYSMFPSDDLITKLNLLRK